MASPSGRDVSGQPQPKRRKSVKGPAADPAPTGDLQVEPAVVMLQEAQTALAKHLEASVEKGPFDMAGLAAYDLANYKKEMKQVGRYECLVPYPEVELLAFTHRSIAPTLGAIQKMAKLHRVGDGGSWSFQSWSEAVVVRATSRTEPPASGTLQTVSHDAYRASFLYAWHEKAKLGEDTKDFQKGCRCMRIVYFFLPTEEVFELEKWKLAEKGFGEAEAQVLQGLKRARAVKEVETMLRTQGRACTPEAMEKWFGNQVSTMSAKTIGTMLKISARFQVPGACLMVQELDSCFGPSHVLGYHHNLNLVCQKTSVNKNDPLQDDLLLWVLESLKDDIFEKKVDATIGQPLLKVHVARSLLKRRVVAFLTRKFGAKNGPLQQSFHSIPAFKASGLHSAHPASLAWLQKMPDYQQEVASFAAKVMRGSPEMNELMDRLLAQNNLLAPEACLLELSKAGIYDHEGLLQQMADFKAEEEKAKEIAQAPVEELVPVVEKPALPDASSEAVALEAEAAPDAIEEPPAVEIAPSLDRCPAFPKLRHHLPSLFTDILQKNPDDVKFESLLDDALIRRNTYVDLRVAPGTAAEWLSALQNGKLGDGPKFFRVDAKTMSSKPLDTPYVYRSKPLMVEGVVKDVFTALLGDPSVKGQQDIFFTEHDILMIHDGRAPSNTQLIKKELKKRLRDKSLFFTRTARSFCELRMLYHNREFMEGGFAVCHRKSGAHLTTASITPEPLETAILIQGKSLCLPLRARQWCDLPGDNSARGWANLGLKDGDARRLSTLPRDTLDAMAGAEGAKVKASESEAEDSDGMKSNADTVSKTRFQCLHPWEAEESQLRELFNCFQPPSPSPNKAAVIIDFSSGVSAALAACRDKRSYVGFVPNELTRAILYEMILLQILLEMAQDHPNGFVRKKRHLTRTQSLGGSEDISVQPTPPSEEPNADPRADDPLDGGSLSESGASEAEA